MIFDQPITTQDIDYIIYKLQEHGSYTIYFIKERISYILTHPLYRCVYCNNVSIRYNRYASSQFYFACNICHKEAFIETSQIHVLNIVPTKFIQI